MISVSEANCVCACITMLFYELSLVSVVVFPAGGAGVSKVCFFISEFDIATRLFVIEVHFACIFI